MKSVKVARVSSQLEDVSFNVWSDSVMHIGVEDSWPAQAVPLFVYCGKDRPQPAYREVVKFRVKEEKYVNLCLRMRCGGLDRYMGGTIGLVHSPDRAEAVPGTMGQLVTVTDIVVMPDSTVVLSCVGDLPFRVKRLWMPRGLRGLQMAAVDVTPVVPRLDSIMAACDADSSLCRFASLLRAAAPALAEMLIKDPANFTVFVPTTKVLNAAMGFLRDEDVVGRTDIEAVLRSHIVPSKLACEALYNGRALHALDGTILIVTFPKWPRGDARVNDIPIEHMDILCSNGVIHTINGLLVPAPASTERHGQPRY